MNFRQAVRKFRELKAEFNAGRLTEEQFRSMLRELMVQDPSGTWWMIGYDTERWYLFNGSAWVPADPPGLSPDESSPGILHPPNRAAPPASQPGKAKPAPQDTFSAGPAREPISGRPSSSPTPGPSTPPKAFIGAGIGALLLILLFGGIFLLRALPSAIPNSGPAAGSSNGLSSKDVVMDVAATGGLASPTSLPTLAPTSTPQPSPTPPSTPIVAPQQWNGYYFYNTGQKQNINFLIEKVNGLQFTGKMIWQSYGSWKGAILRMQGEFVSDFGDSHEQARWKNLSDYSSNDRSGPWLKWTETELIQGSDYTVNGWYYGHIRKDGTLSAVYFYNADETTADSGGVTLKLAP